MFLKSSGFSSRAVSRSAGFRLDALAFLLIISVLTTSCALLDQNKGQSNSQALSLFGSLPNGTTNQAYNTVLSVSGGSAPYQFTVASGGLPPGLTLNSSTGSITGTPTTTGSYSFQIAATDLPNPHQGARNFSISVEKSGTIHISVTPSNATIASGQSQAFTATVTGTSNTGATWSASLGSITADGIYTAPQVAAPTNASLTAASKADPSVKSSVAVTVQPASSSRLAITNGTLPNATAGSAYNAKFTASGGIQPYRWSVSAGTLPQGLNLSQGDGQFSGIPGSAGAYSFTVTVHDAGVLSDQKTFTVNVQTGSNFDGPAELPRVTMNSSLASTPAPGTVIPVHAGGDLQAAVNSAQCGDTISLQAGATFTGNFKFPAKSCDSNHWIIVRTSAPDSALPSEGQRLTPCYGGVSSLPGRPQYSCPNPQNVLPKLVFGGTGDGPVIFQTGANHYRLIGLEITRPVGVKGGPGLISVEAGGVADHLIVDRSWVHGTAQDETQVGLLLNGTNYVAAVDSYFSDFHCTSLSGSCTDAHAVGGGNGDHPGGQFRIENNFLEASGESFMLGGGPATTSPTDVVVRHNHFFKPLQWMQGDPNFVGGTTGDPFIVKNHLELKNAVRVLIEANLMENSWGGFSQMGFSILLTPKNQHSPSGNVCPNCQVTDVTIRYTQITHAAGGIQMATAISGDGTNGGPAFAGTRWSIHDVVIDDINKDYVGGGSLFELQNGWPNNPLNTVTINHVTGFPDPAGHLMIIGNQNTNPSMHGFVFVNNLVTTAAYPVWNTGGGSTSCAYSDIPITVVATCFSTYQFHHNALIASPDHLPASSWPANNFFPATGQSAGFKNFNAGSGGDYELISGSPYKGKGSDGRDLGADIPGIKAALADVE